MRNYTVWKLMISRNGGRPVGVTILAENSFLRHRNLERAVERFYEIFEAGGLDDYFDGEANEWIVVGADRLAEEAYL